MRIFVAIAMPEATAEAIGRVQADIPFGRIVPEEQLHLTLAFLGDLKAAEIEAAHDALEGVRSGAPEVAFGGLVLPDPARPDVLALQVAADPGLLALQRSIMGRLRQAGLDLPRRRFRPHVTIARFGGRLAPEAEVRLAAILSRNAAARVWPFTARSFGLYRSYLRAAGAIHAELMLYPCG